MEETEKEAGDSRHQVERQEDDQHIPEELGCTHNTAASQTTVQASHVPLGTCCNAC